MGSKTGFLTISEALRQGTKLLEEAAVPVPRLTAEVLLAHALRQERVYLLRPFERRAHRARLDSLRPLSA